jgi:hypothetical protein
VKPEVVMQAKFNEWTQSGKLREPTYLGLRNDSVPTTVRRESIIRPPSRDTDGPRPSFQSRRRDDHLPAIRGEAAAMLANWMRYSRMVRRARWRFLTAAVSTSMGCTNRCGRRSELRKER